MRDVLTISMTAAALAVCGVWLMLRLDAFLNSMEPPPPENPCGCPAAEAACTGRPAAQPGVEPPERK